MRDEDKEFFRRAAVARRLAQWYVEDAERGIKDPKGRDAALGEIKVLNEMLRAKVAIAKFMQRKIKIEVDIPIKTVSEANGRGHWAPKAARVKLHRHTAQIVARKALDGIRPLPCVVTLTRLSPRELDDDNLPQALKACRDGIADYFDVDDRDPSIRWEYGQQKTSKYHAVRMTVEELV